MVNVLCFLETKRAHVRERTACRFLRFLQVWSFAWPVVFEWVEVSWLHAVNAGIESHVTAFRTSAFKGFPRRTTSWETPPPRTVSYQIAVWQRPVTQDARFHLVREREVEEIVPPPSQLKTGRHPSRAIPNREMSAFPTHAMTGLTVTPHALSVHRLTAITHPSRVLWAVHALAPFLLLKPGSGAQVLRCSGAQRPASSQVMAPREMTS